MNDEEEKEEGLFDPFIKFGANAYIRFLINEYKLNLLQVMTECREIVELLYRVSKANDIEIKEDIIDEAYKLRLRCFFLIENIGREGPKAEEEKDLFPTWEEVIEGRKKLWNTCEKEVNRMTELSKEKRIAEKAADIVLEDLKIIKAGKEASEKSKVPKKNDDIPGYR